MGPEKVCTECLWHLYSQWLKIGNNCKCPSTNNESVMVYLHSGILVINKMTRMTNTLNSMDECHKSNTVQKETRCKK